MALTGVSTSVVDMSGDTTGLVIAKGTTAERDAISSPQAGMIRNNTETDRVEVYNGTDWRNLVEAGNAALPLTVDYLVVGGGGGAGAAGLAGSGSGGGGAGGLLTSIGTTALTLDSNGTYSVTVGDGGAGAIGVQTPRYTTGNNGANSEFSGTGITTITATGGGGGSSGSDSQTTANIGGSGGGSGYSGTGAAGTTGQGNAGGSSSSGPPYAASG